MTTSTLSTTPTAKDSIQLLEKQFLSYFGTSEVVLVDRGSQFTAKEFRFYVVNSLQSVLIHTSPSYPQGNAINYSSHNILLHTIKSRISLEPDTPFDVLVSDATLAYNASPHSVTGQSPFFMLTGQDMMLPGLHRLNPPPSHAVRLANIRENRLRALVAPTWKRQCQNQTMIIP
eukprot:GHVP01016647.1.p2 GENE.GHVP01016647.1~~GHVP01016647.1.p2  ORF type:complete len:174 (+),score=14.95 GHVP01016647.1:1704-2225(+)